jgi:hypothetical protein
MANAPSRPSIDDNLGACNRQDDRNPVTPPLREANTLENLEQEWPSDRIEKAFARSTFRSMDGHGQRLAFSQRHANCTDLKFSWILRPLMKAVWLSLTRSFILGASHIARPLENNFPTLCIKLIGL